MMPQDSFRFNLCSTEKKSLLVSMVTNLKFGLSQEVGNWQTFRSLDKATEKLVLTLRGAKVQKLIFNLTHYLTQLL